MSAIKILIIEGNDNDAKRLKKFLKKNRYQITGIARNFKEALESYKFRTPDLVISDVFLDGAPKGMSIVKMVQKESSPARPFIFLTNAADKRTFEQVREADPYCYLVKPFNESELRYNIELAVQKYTGQRDAGQNGFTGGQTGYPRDDSTMLLKSKPGELANLPITKDFFIKKGDYLVNISLYDVALIQVGGKYTTFHSNKGTFLVEQSLEYLELRLPSDLFMRVHRNYIVNIHNIDKIHLTEYTIYLKDKRNIPISRRYKDMLAKKITILR